MSKRKLIRRKGIWYDYTYDGCFSKERIKGFWKRYWRRWLRRQEKSDNEN